MAKIPYMVTENYVRSWTPLHAMREVISNGIDAETVKGSTLNVRHDARKSILYVRNERAKLDTTALYFGGTDKSGDDRMIGQYGEGLKLAMLVLARENIPMKIHNGAEDWDVKIEPDDRGVRVLTLYTRKAKHDDGCVEIEIHGVNADMWYELRGMFIRLLPPLEVISTAYGDIYSEPERVGKIYVKGVYVGPFKNSAFGYNIKDLEVGRDRISFDEGTAQSRIARAWEDAVTRGQDVAQMIFDAFLKRAEDMDGFSWMTLPGVSTAMVTLFKDRYGDDAYPVSGSAEVGTMEHLGYRGVILPHPLVKTLLNTMPSVTSIKKELGKNLKAMYGIDELAPAQRRVLLDGIAWMKKACGVEDGIEERIKVVEFQDPALTALHKGGEILLSLGVLDNFGKAVAIMIHEFSHDEGLDGSASHELAQLRWSEQLLNCLYEATRLAPSASASPAE